MDEQGTSPCTTVPDGRLLNLFENCCGATAAHEHALWFCTGDLTRGAVWMPGTTWDFGEATWINADALGKPGQRRFRLLVHSRPETAWLWCEKEQLHALAIATEQVLLQFGEEIGRDWAGDSPPENPPSPTVEFTVGRLALGYDQDQSSFALLAYDREIEDEDAPATLVCRVSKTQLRNLAEHIVALAAAGRPRCPLCGAPMDAEGHICPRANGRVRTVE